MVILLIKLKTILLIIMSNNVTRQDLYDLTHKELGISKNECIKFVDLVFESILKNFEEGNKVKVSLFGSFDVKDKKARIGRNPKTKEEKEISSRRVVTFKPSKFLSKKINK
jgi:integration host factor subunit alpha